MTFGAACRNVAVVIPGVFYFPVELRRVTASNYGNSCIKRVVYGS